jgi:CheY-like chemotaxis protein
MERKIWAIVDDEFIFHLTTKQLIKQTNLDKSILAFKNGKEAIDHIIAHKTSIESLPDVILLDLKMPVMDGWDFLEEYLPLKSELPKEITIFIVTSSVDQNDMDRAKSISAVKKYIVKPINEFKMNELVEELKAA